MYRRDEPATNGYVREEVGCLAVGLMVFVFVMVCLFSLGVARCRRTLRAQTTTADSLRAFTSCYLGAP